MDRSGPLDEMRSMPRGLSFCGNSIRPMISVFFFYFLVSSASIATHTRVCLLAIGLAIIRYSRFNFSENLPLIFMLYFS